MMEYLDHFQALLQESIQRLGRNTSEKFRAYLHRQDILRTCLSLCTDFIGRGFQQENR